MNYLRLLGAAAGLLTGTLIVTPARAASSMERALETARKTGRPILAVAGTET